MNLNDTVIKKLEKLPAGNVADNNPKGGVMDAGIIPVETKPISSPCAFLSTAADIAQLA